MAIPFASQHTDSFPKLLNLIGGSLLVSTYQAGQWVLLRADGDTINTHFLGMEKPMGAAFRNGRVALGSGPRVWDYRAMPMVAPKVEPTGKHTNCYLPRGQHITGDIDIHEMAFDADDDLWLVNTRMSCLCTMSAEHSVVPRWRPPFVTGLDLSDRCHLNGLAMRDGKPRYVTALGETDVAAGWRENKASGGLLMDISDNRIISRGLSMPHSPRWHQQQLLVLESGDGGLCRIDPQTGDKTTIARLPGFTRGMDFAAQVAFIGLSEVRETAVFAGLPLTRREADRKCGIWAVDVNTGQVLAFLVFTGAVREIFAVQVLPDRFPVLLEPDHALVHTSYSLPDEALKDVVAPPPHQVQIGTAQQAAAKKDYAGAAAILRELLGEDPAHAAAQLMLGVVLTDDEQWEESLIVLRRAIELQPDSAEAFNSLGFAYAGLGQHGAALEAFERAIELDNKFALAQMNRGMVLLKMGRYEQGWKSFEYRWQTPHFPPFNCPQPQWQGEDIHDKTLLVHTEQGAGDAIMCARFLAQARARCKKLILVAPENLRDLLGTAAGVDEVRLPGQLPTDLFDTFCPIMSLPGALGITLDNLPAETPYLSVPGHVSASTLKGDGIKIGFAWRGSQTMRTNHHRSCELQDFAPLFELPGIAWFSFQMPVNREEAEWLEAHGVTNLEPELPGFARTAALAGQMDHVISVDTSLVHLAGALGIPTWVMLGQDADWRWHTEGDESQWYPGTRLFRAQPGEDWSGRIERVRNALAATEAGTPIKRK
jgi:uncharacterized protein (TIGR03032 family)